MEFPIWETLQRNIVSLIMNKGVFENSEENQCVMSRVTHITQLEP